MAASDKDDIDLLGDEDHKIMCRHCHAFIRRLEYKCDMKRHQSNNTCLCVKNNRSLENRDALMNPSF